MLQPHFFSMSAAQVEAQIEPTRITENQDENPPEPTQPSVEVTQGANDNDTAATNQLTPNPASIEVHQSLQSLVETFEQVLSHTGDRKSSLQFTQKEPGAPFNTTQPRSQSQPPLQLSQSQNDQKTVVDPLEIGHTQPATTQAAASNNNDNESADPAGSGISSEPQNNGSVNKIADDLSQCTIATAAETAAAATEAETPAAEPTASDPPSADQPPQSDKPQPLSKVTTDSNHLEEKEAEQQNQVEQSQDQKLPVIEENNEEASNIQRPITTSASGTEIQEESLKNALKEIIHEIDQAVSESQSDDKAKSAPQENGSFQPQFTQESAEFGGFFDAAQLRPGTPPSYYLYDPSTNTSSQQPWCGSSNIFNSSESYTTNVEEQTYDTHTYDVKTRSGLDTSSPVSSSSPYFLTRPSRLTPVPFASYSGHSHLDEPMTSCPITSVSVESKDSVSWNHTNDQASFMSEEKGMSVSGDGSYAPPRIDLEKIFTPAPESDMNYLPTRRKIYGSSSFYSETHPTVEEQVQLARKISQSLTDANNQKSKGQSMYVKRKKKSVKWIHEGPDGTFTGGEEESSVEQSNPNMDSSQHLQKPLMKLVMNPSGHVKDWQSLKQSGMYNDHGALSPEICQNLVKDMHSPTGKGAQLFAKRRKKAENWIVDETNVKRSGTAPSLSSNLNAPGGKPFYTLPRKPQSQFMPAPSFIDKTRMQHAQKLNEIQERFARPKLRIIKSPWEAALETGSVDTAFEDLAPQVTMNSLVAAAERKLTQTPSPMTFEPLQPGIQPGDASWELQNYSSSYPGDIEIPAWTSYGQPPKQPSTLNFGTNYNTAPRGFSYGQTIYRPVILN